VFVAILEGFARIRDAKHNEIILQQTGGEEVFDSRRTMNGMRRGALVLDSNGADPAAADAAATVGRYGSSNMAQSTTAWFCLFGTN